MQKACAALLLTAAVLAVPGTASAHHGDGPHTLVIGGSVADHVDGSHWVPVEWDAAVVDVTFDGGHWHRRCVVKTLESVPIPQAELDALRARLGPSVPLPTHRTATVCSETDRRWKGIVWYGGQVTVTGVAAGTTTVRLGSRHVTYTVAEPAPEPTPDPNLPEVNIPRDRIFDGSEWDGTGGNRERERAPWVRFILSDFERGNNPTLNISVTAPDGTVTRHSRPSWAASASGGWQTFFLPTWDDDKWSPDRSYTICAEPGDGYKLGDQPCATVTVTDDDPKIIVSTDTLALAYGETGTYEVRLGFDLEWGKRDCYLEGMTGPCHWVHVQADSHAVDIER